MGAPQGRSGVFALVEQCVERPVRKVHCELPTVVLLGQRGAGKTAVVDAIAGRYAQVVPHACLDLGAADLADRRPWRVVSKLADELARKCPQFGRLPFPLLDLCRDIVGAEIDFRYRRQALAEVLRVLSDHGPLPRARPAIGEQAKHLESTGVLPPLTNVVVDVLLRGAEAVLRGRRLKRVTRLWPGRRGGSSPADPRDQLVDLAAGGDELLDEAFCLAFLADLRGAYEHGLGAYGRTANCVALLDNVDSPSGERFLAVFGRCRAALRGDPLVLVVTSRRWLPVWSEAWAAPGAVAKDRPGTTVRTPEDASLADWQQLRRTAGHDGPWYLVRLRNLTAAEVAGLAVDPATARFVHRLTCGHPLGVRRVLDVLGSDAPLEACRGVLDRADETAEPPVAPLARSLLEYVLGDIEPARPSVMASLAVATDVRLGARLADRGGRDHQSTAEVIRGLRANLLTETTPDGRLLLDPWLRRLVLHELAATGDDDRNGWWMEHSRHRRHHEASGEPVAALRHALALVRVEKGRVVDGDVRQVVEQLWERLRRVGSDADAKAWLADLNLVVSAPNRLPTDVEPWDTVTALASAAEPADPALARLMAARWLLSDPLADPDESLRGSVRRALERLADDHPAGYVTFTDEAEKYSERR